MRRARWAAAALAAAVGLGPAAIARAGTFNVPPGRLGEVAAALGVQAGATVTVTEPDVAARRSPGVRAATSLRAALDQALRGTGAAPVFYDRVTVRIVQMREPTPAPQATPSAAPIEVQELVVTASKQRTPLARYPGSVKLLVLDRGWVAANAAQGTAAITRLSPTLGSTNLGPGRDKLFIRGIADSSFNGPTQATVGQYLGDVRLNYNAPDPDLNLYDIQRVEVLVGPEGTLYGAGSLGGVIRLTPNPPNTHAMSETLSAGVSATRLGGVGGDGAAMINAPLVDGRVALRLVAFGGRQAGYIDDPSRGLQDINSTVTAGQRLTLRLEHTSGWTVDFGFVLQNIASADGQYIVSGAAPLTRDNAIAQPFSNDYRLGYISARRMIGGAELVSTTSFVRHHLTTVFDATGRDGTATPTKFEEDNDITLDSHETRLSGGGSQTPWVAGLSTLFSSSMLSRWLGPLGAPQQITGVINVQAEAALFGQASFRLTSTLTGTVGERLTLSSGAGYLIDPAAGGSPLSTRNAAKPSATLALDWRPGGPLSAFFHYQQGYRAGGLAIAPSGSGVLSQKFAADDLNMDELGVRWGEPAHDRLWVRAAAFFADWHNIQADLVDSSGLPYTTNIGHGFLYGLDGEIAWRPAPAVTLSAAVFVNHSRLVRPAPAFATGGSQTLPNVARDGGRIAAEWRRPLAPGIALTGGAALRYVGESRLGVGEFLDIPQGNYLVADANARLDFGRVGLSLDIDNLGDTRANTFAFGDPFSLAQRNQQTPLRPRTVRVGLGARF